MRRFLLFVVQLCGAALGNVEIIIEKHPSTDWDSARKVCQIYNQLLLPDLGDEFYSLPQMTVNKFFWINAKMFNVSYPRGSIAYLKYALYPADSILDLSLCYNKSRNEVISIDNALPWNDARSFCETQRLNLLDLTNTSEVRRTISAVYYNKPAWLENVTDYNLLSFESTSENITESCAGMVKLQSGKVLYEKDDCSSRHAYFCVHLGNNRYATTLTKLSTPIENVSEKNFNGPSTLPGPTTASDKGMPEVTKGSTSTGTAKVETPALDIPKKNEQKYFSIYVYAGAGVGGMALISTLVAVILIQRRCGCIRCRKMPKEMPSTASTSLNANQAYDVIDTRHFSSSNTETKPQTDVKSKYETLMPEKIQPSEYSFVLDVNSSSKTQSKVGELSHKGNIYDTTQPFRKAPSTYESVYNKTYTSDFQENVYNKTNAVCLGENVYNETDTDLGENVYNKTFESDVSQVQVPVTYEYRSLK